MTTIDDCRILPFPKVSMPQGNLTSVAGHEAIPFEIRRVFYVYDVPGGESRGGHAHRQLHQVILSAMGSFSVELDDGYRRRTVTMNRAYYGLHVPPMVWCELTEFSSGGIALVLASMAYEESDYIRDHSGFVREKQNVSPFS